MQNRHVIWVFCYMALMASRFRYCRFRNEDYGSFLLTHVSLPILLSNYFTWILALWNQRCRILNSWWMPSLNWKTDERYCERISFVVNHVYVIMYVYRNWSMKSSAWTLISVCFDVWIRPRMRHMIESLISIHLRSLGDWGNIRAIHGLIEIKTKKREENPNLMKWLQYLCLRLHKYYFS